jgi:hypothetical protein
MSEDTRANSSHVASTLTRNLCALSGAQKKSPEYGQFQEQKNFRRVRP